MTSASEWVTRFAAVTAQSLEIFKLRFDGLLGTAKQGLVATPADGGRPLAHGPLPGVGEFRLHGRGCRFEFPDGAFVDLDWDTDGRGVFDSWRVLMFARSSGHRDVTQREIRQAMRKSKELWHVQDDWYTWADRSYDITWLRSSED